MNEIYKGSDISILLNFGNIDFKNVEYINLYYFTEDLTKINCSYIKDGELINMKILDNQLYAIITAEDSINFTSGYLNCECTFGISDELFPDKIRDTKTVIKTNITII